ncbi:MAG: hypothetical protein OEZ65_13350 [Gemmatimonadota bacterium]|nr:hypothetical protein [Gemmatimonadota bacterium]MDH5760569.1 hypothetical protein [Gemmatimonadota bacterium]
MSVNTSSTARAASYRVLDAMDAPHKGRILRVRLQSGEAPPIKSLKGARFRAVAPDGRSCYVRVTGFALFGGKSSNERWIRTGRADLQVEEEGEGGPVGLRWQLTRA